MVKKTKQPTCSPNDFAQNLQNKTDFFGATINFNINGKNKITSLPGSILSIALGITFLFYAY